MVGRNPTTGFSTINHVKKAKTESLERPKRAETPSQPPKQSNVADSYAQIVADNAHLVLSIVRIDCIE